LYGRSRVGTSYKSDTAEIALVMPEVKQKPVEPEKKRRRGGPDADAVAGRRTRDAYA
jgi:hypothetical protein